VLNKVESVLSLLASTVEARLIIPSIFNAYKPLRAKGPKTLVRLLGFMETVLGHIPRETISAQLERLFKFFLELFDYARTSRVSGKDQDSKIVGLVEEGVVRAFLALVMKLNENAFKPIFLKVIDWAGEAVPTSPKQENQLEAEKVGVCLPRYLFFYRLVDALADKLKSIFVPYFGYLLDDSIAFLTGQKYRTKQDGEDLMKKEQEKEKETKKIRKYSDDEDESDEEDSEEEKNGGEAAKWQQQEVNKHLPKQEMQLRNLLVCHILSGLHKCFLYDNENFVSAEKFERLVPALVGQIDNTSGGPERYRHRMDTYLIPCLGQLAATVADDKLWKTLNYQVLLRTRSGEATVRFAAVCTVEEFFKRLREEFLVLLPETVPFLAELMEDSNAQVEQRCQQLIAFIDNLLGEGESITSYLH
jgi:U3 small nucleolar RNA-associated protein 10